MKEFLNLYYEDNRDIDEQRAGDLTSVFTATVTAVEGTIGRRAFRPSNALNAAVYDAVMVGVARRLRAGPIHDGDALRTAYDGLLANEDFQKFTSKATADIENVRGRIELATNAFADVT